MNDNISHLYPLFIIVIYLRQTTTNSLYLLVLLFRLILTVFVDRPIIFFFVFVCSGFSLTKFFSTTLWPDNIIPQKHCRLAQKASLSLSLHDDIIIHERLHERQDTGLFNATISLTLDANTNDIPIHT
jgi:hypothetical protein